MFVTGTSLVPINGFKELTGMRGIQKFSIFRQKIEDDKMLPCGHTCFNQLDLPTYSSLEVMKTKLLLAVNEGYKGFGFG